MSMNINGLNQANLTLFSRLFSRHDVVAFQETKFSDFDHVRRANYFAHVADTGVRTFWSHQEDSDFSAARGRADVSLVFSSRCPFKDLQDVTPTYASADLEHHYIVVEATLNDYKIFIHVVYAPVTVQERKRFLDSLPTQFPAGAHHLVVGDFNVSTDPLLDESQPYPHDLGRGEFRSWLIQMGVLDAWRTTFPDHRQFSGPKRRNRIDYCLMSPALFDGYLRAVRHVTEDRWHHEDHLPIEFELKSPTQPEHSRLPWKCPRWLLQVPAVQIVLERALDTLGRSLRCGIDDNPGALLDEHKRADGIFLRQMFHEFKNRDQDQLQNLRQRQYDAETAHAADPTDTTDAALTAAKTEFEAFSELLASRREQVKFDKDIRTGESGAGGFLRPPSDPEQRVSIPSVAREDGTLATEEPEKAALHRHYWGSLFQSPSHDLKGRIPQRRFQPLELERLMEHTTVRLTEDDRRMLDAPMTANDFYWAIRTSPKGRSSGFDGLPAEYYQLFPEKWARIYEMVYSGQLARGRMSKFQRRAYISLLYKKGDRSLPSNYRPITLLNHDAKFGPKIIAQRVGHVLPKLLHTDQTGFVPGRLIRHTLLRFQDLQQFAKTHNLPDAGAVLLDFAKAFDSVLWPALDQVLSHFGFGTAFRNTVPTFYSGTLVSVLVNGTASKFFELGCGVRQGDPLSPALFVLFIEPMQNFLRAKTGSLGIALPSETERHHLVAFADDCTGLLSDLRDAPRFVNAVQDYASAAGLRLNVSKTAVMPFQALDPDIREALEGEGFSVTADDGQARLLGIMESPTLPINRRFDRLLPQMVARAQRWKYRARTLRGRAVILRTIILPLLWFTAAVTPVTPQVATQVKNLCKAFLFQRPLSPIGECTSTHGVRVAPLANQAGWAGHPRHQKLRCCHAHVLLARRRSKRDNDDASPRWFQPAIELANCVLGDSGLGFDIMYAVVPRTNPASPRWTVLGEFWFTTLQSWQRLRDSSATRSTLTPSRLDAPLWVNAFFLVGTGKRTFERASKLGRHFRERGYIRLRDFISRHGSLPKIPRMPHEPLEIEEEPDWESCWSREISLDRDLLPVLSDVKFRLQHHALNVRVKYRWHTTEVQCAHGCSTPETAKHLFWDCPFAAELWKLSLEQLAPLLASPVTWPMAIYLQDVQLTDQAVESAGQHNFLRVFNIVRSCIFRSLWLHRNEKIFKPSTQTSGAFLLRHAKCYIKMHARHLAETPNNAANTRLKTLCRRLQDPSAV